MDRFEDLIETLDYALDDMRIEVSHAKEFMKRTPSKNNEEYLKKAEFNVSVLEECALLLESLKKL